jgi:hypothetical protein
MKTSKIRGTFQKFCTLYVFSLKMNLFYKIRLQAFNVISIMLYHSGPTFGQFLYSCWTPSLLLRLVTQVTSFDTSFTEIHFNIIVRGTFQKFCTLYVFSLKMNLFYKIHLQGFNVISIVLYHSGPTFGKVLYSCLDAFVANASDYSGHLIRHLLNASEAFPTEWFLQV